MDDYKQLNLNQLWKCWHGDDKEGDLSVLDALRRTEQAAIANYRAQHAQVEKDAERYRHICDRESSLETRQYDEAIINGRSCYHIVDGVRELKWGEKLDEAIDAAIAAAKRKI